MINEQNETAGQPPEMTHQASNMEPATDNQKKEPGKDVHAPPDGGLQAWLVVLGGFCTVFASFGWINCRST
jgi:hypothetical protein